MSFDIRLEIDTGGPHPASVTETRNPTYNLAPMFAAALGRPIGSLDGMLAADALPIVDAGAKALLADRSRFEAMNPPNGWGDFDGALQTLQQLGEDCRAHPKATVRV